MKLLTVIAVLFTLVVPAAQAAPAPAPCVIGGPCPKLDFKPNHICYLPDSSFAPEDVCYLPIGIVDVRYNPPRPIPAPWPIFYFYSVLPVDGPPRGFVAVPGNYATIAAGATGGVVPVQLVPGSPLPEERARVQIQYGDGPPLVAEVLIKAR
jgi:hypothetical protein